MQRNALRNNVGDDSATQLADHLVLARAGERDHLRLVGRHGKVIGAEMHQPLAEQQVSGRGDGLARLDYLPDVRLNALGLLGLRFSLLAGVAALDDDLGVDGEDLGRGGQSLDFRGVGDRSRLSASRDRAARRRSRPPARLSERPSRSGWRR